MFYALVKDEESWARKINLFIAIAPLLKIDAGKDALVS